MPTVLVTGASGHMGVFTVLEYLKHKYTVQTTIRDISKKDQVLEMIAKTGNLSSEEAAKIRFFEADLNEEKGWAEAMEGCDYVCHVAYPYLNFVAYEKLEKAAVQGTMNVLKLAASSPTVKHLVYCSTFAAVGLDNHPEGTIVDDDCYTSVDSPLIDGYVKTKIVVEKKMWEFIRSKEQNPTGLTMTSICPLGVAGPLPYGYTKLVGPAQFFHQWLTGDVPEVPNFYLHISDVRDIAKAFLKATEDSKTYNERFILQTEEPFGTQQFLDIIKTNFPEETKNVPAKVGKLLVPPIKITNAKAVRLLDYQPVDPEKSVVDLFRSVLENTKASK